MGIVVPIAKQSTLNELGSRMWYFDTIVSALDELRCKRVLLPNIPGEWYFMLDDIVVRVVPKDDLHKAYNPTQIRLRTMLYAVGILRGEAHQGYVSSLFDSSRESLDRKVQKLQRIGCRLDPSVVIPKLTDFEHPYGILSESGA